MTHTDQPAREEELPPVPTSVPAAKATTRREGPGGVSPGVARQIDENLRRLYRQRVEQELPPELQALVARLRGENGTAEDGKEAATEGQK